MRPNAIMTLFVAVSLGAGFSSAGRAESRDEIPLYTNADLARLGSLPASPSLQPTPVEPTDWSGLQTFLDHEYGRIAAQRAYEDGRRAADADRERADAVHHWSLPGYYPGYWGDYYGGSPYAADRDLRSTSRANPWLGHPGGHGRYSFLRGEDAFPDAPHNAHGAHPHRGGQGHRGR